jgi:hypothetical protein
MTASGLTPWADASPSDPSATPPPSVLSREALSPRRLPGPATGANGANGSRGVGPRSAAAAEGPARGAARGYCYAASDGHCEQRDLTALRHVAAALHLGDPHCSALRPAHARIWPAHIWCRPLGFAVSPPTSHFRDTSGVPTHSIANRQISQQVTGSRASFSVQQHPKMRFMSMIKTWLVRATSEFALACAISFSLMHLIETQPCSRVSRRPGRAHTRPQAQSLSAAAHKL